MTHPLSLHINWSDEMKNLVVAIVVGSAALAGGSAANAASTFKAKPDAQANQSQADRSTDFSARHRHHHWHGHRHWRPHGYYRPHYRSYGYYPRSYGYYGGGPYGYYGGGPGVSFSFGSGRW
jgi:hypothetical protein